MGLTCEHIPGLSADVGVSGKWQAGGGWGRVKKGVSVSQGWERQCLTAGGSEEEGVTLKEYGLGFLPLLPNSVIFLFCKPRFCRVRPHYLGHYGAIIF